MLGDISGLEKIYIVCGYTDMRKSIDGICAIIEDQLKMDPASSVLFLFCGRRRDRIKVETDGYQGYNSLPDIKRCSCWAHIRRYFIDAVPKGKQYDYSQPAVQGVQYCNRLFAIEDSINKKYAGDYEKRKAGNSTDLSGGWPLQLYEQSQRERDPSICGRPEELAVQ